MKTQLKMAMVALTMVLGLSQVAHANYYDLARQEAEAQAAREAARAEGERQNAIQDFNRKITRMVYGFARAHRGFAGGSPELQMNNLIPGRILRYIFATNDGFECAASPSFWGPSDVTLNCINSRTGKHLDLRK